MMQAMMEGAGVPEEGLDLEIEGTSVAICCFASIFGVGHVWFGCKKRLGEGGKK